MTDKILPGCTGKEAITNKPDADRIARRMRQNHEDDCYVEPYKCRHCHWWHIGQARDKTPARRKREDRADMR